MIVYRCNVRRLGPGTRLRLHDRWTTSQHIRGRRQTEWETVRIKYVNEREKLLPSSSIQTR